MEILWGVIKHNSQPLLFTALFLVLNRKRRQAGFKPFLTTGRALSGGLPVELQEREIQEKDSMILVKLYVSFKETKYCDEAFRKFRCDPNLLLDNS